MDTVTTLSAKIDRFRDQVADGVAEPWRSGLLAILEQLHLAMEAVVSFRTATAADLVATAERLTSAQLANVRRNVLPPKPADVSEAAIFDRKADLVRLLDLQPAGDELVEYVLSLAWEALRDGDALTTYCLAAGPLDFYYRARGASHVRVREQILALRGGSAVARLLEYFSGPDGIASLVLELKQALLSADMIDEVQRSLLRPGLGPDDDAGQLTPEERQELEAIEQEFRQVAAIAGELGASPEGPEPPVEPGRPDAAPLGRPGPAGPPAVGETRRHTRHSRPRDTDRTMR